MIDEWFIGNTEKKKEEYCLELKLPLFKIITVWGKGDYNRDTV